MGMFTGVLGKVLGANVLQDVSTFVTAMDSMFGGFRERADRTYRLLQAPGTAFLVVAAPERDALREAAYFVDRLETDRMPLAGLVLNRVHSTGAPQLTAERALAAAETLESPDQEDPTATSTATPTTAPTATPTAATTATSPETEVLAAGLLRLHAELMQRITRERRMRDRFVSIYPDVPVVEVPALAGDVHDLDGLREIGDRLNHPEQ
jgi:anion-transporting  ArsA/GET3 family ATPase